MGLLPTSGWSAAIHLRPGWLVRPQGETWREVAGVMHQDGPAGLHTLLMFTDGSAHLHRWVTGEIEIMTPRHVARWSRKREGRTWQRFGKVPRQRGAERTSRSAR